ncbi:MAG: cell division protein FtsA [Candidatus Atribacteria bacterium]|nr:cell division protein FtsA [Candidatus Atribacteria bacterium]
MKGEILIGGLDIGTDKTNTLIAEVLENNHLEIVGIGSVPSKGVKRGVIVDLEQAAQVARESIANAERMAGVEIGSGIVSVNGSHISSFNSQGVIAISKEHPEIGEEDIEKVIEAAKAGVISPDRELIHVLPREFILDGQKGISDPMGMTGSRLEGKVHIVTGSVTAVQNLLKCMEMADFEVDELIFGSLACGNAILTKTEKELGVLLIDIGAGTSDISIFLNDNMIYSSILPLGGIQVTNDLAIGLKTSIEESERLKLKYGSVIGNYISPEDMIEISKTNGKEKEKISKKYLIDIIEPRMQEIFGLIKEELERANYDRMFTQGVVLTGGCAFLPGIAELAGKVFNTNTRIGKPDYQGELGDLINEPRFSTVMGLIVHAFEEGSLTGFSKQGKSKSGPVLTRFVNWLRDFF